jgi:hypothetical protein
MNSHVFLFVFFVDQNPPYPHDQRRPISQWTRLPFPFVMFSTFANPLPVSLSLLPPPFREVLISQCKSKLSIW